MSRNCRQAVLQASKKAKLSATQKKAVQTAYDNADDHPIVWKAVEHMLRRRYERKTSKKMAANFDWSTILDWLMTAMPMILKLLFMFI